MFVETRVEHVSCGGEGAEGITYLSLRGEKGVGEGRESSK